MVVSFEAVQALRDLHDDVSALSAHFNGDLKIIEVLKRLKQGRKPGHAFELYVNLLHGYNESAAVLHKRVQNVIDLVSCQSTRRIPLIESPGSRNQLRRANTSNRQHMLLIRRARKKRPL